VPIPAEQIRHDAPVAERDGKWAMVVGLCTIVTLMPVAIAVLIFSLADGLGRVTLLAFPLAGLILVLPFWPPLLRADHERINEMLERRRNRR
jgi:hypothetical protein